MKECHSKPSWHLLTFVTSALPHPAFFLHWWAMRLCDTKKTAGLSWVLRILLFDCVGPPYSKGLDCQSSKISSSRWKHIVVEKCWEHHSQKYEISVESLSDAFRHNSNLLESVKFLKELTCTDSGFWCYWCPMVSLKVLTCYGKNWWSRLADAVVLHKCLLQFDPTVSKCSWRLKADQCARSTRPSVRTTKENGLKNRTL